MASPKFISRIIVKSKITVPDTIVHFHVQCYDHHTYTDIPFDFTSMEEVGHDLKKYNRIDEIDTSADALSDDTKALIGIARLLDIDSFLIESFTDYGDSYPIEDLINVIIDRGNILHTSIESPVDQETRDHFRFIYEYEYDDIMYSGYETARIRFQKKREEKESLGGTSNIIEGS